MTDPLFDRPFVNRMGLTAPPVPQAIEILREVCERHNITHAELVSRRRQDRLVKPRHEAMYLIARRTSLSLPQIGREMGGFDHTTVLHGIWRHEQRMREASGVEL